MAKKECQFICRLCDKEWLGKMDEKDVPPWGILYTWCGTCRKKMEDSFEKQMAISINRPRLTGGS